MENNNLFAPVSKDVPQEKEKDFYDEMLGQRVQPELINLEETKEKSNIDPEKEMKLKEADNQKIYSYEEALKESTVYFGGDDLAAKVWINKYALKNSNSDLFELSPDDMHKRLAKEIARIEKKYINPLGEEEIYNLLKDFKYIIPQGSPMAGIGNHFQVGSLSNCFVIGNEGNCDSYGGIMKTDQEQVQLMKRRGGVGHDMSYIRPDKSPVKNSALSSTGIVPFMERFSNSTREVAQDGRRGALMLSISIKHPDAEKFIDAKLEAGKVTGANISVKITDEFMDAVFNNKEFVQQYPIDCDNPKVTKKIDARGLWNKIIHNAWKSAEPGILFWDTIIRESVPDCYSDLGFTTVSTNPCGEIPLCPYDSCRLLAINLYSFVENPFTEKASFNSELFSKYIHYAQRIMDDIIDLELEKIDKIIEKIYSDPESDDIKKVEKDLWVNIKNKSREGRRTGIGITAEGDMIAALGSKYGTNKATDFSVEVHKNLAIESYRSSVNLAKERGAFPVYDFKKEKENPFILRIKKAAPLLYEEMKKYGRRNIALLTIAPTGTVSLMSQTTSGIEPVFQIAYKRRRKVNPNDKDVTVNFVDEVGDSWEEYDVLHNKFAMWLSQNGYNVDEVSKMNDKSRQEIIKQSPYYQATANDVDWVAKVKMQGAVQKWVDHSISVTVNVPQDITEDLIGKVYENAWRSGCKGMTVYRDGSRAGVLVTNEEKDDDFKETNAPPRPKSLKAEVLRFQNDYEKWVAIVGLYKGRPYEIFTGKAEGFYVPTWVQNGWVIKNKLTGEKSRYDFQYQDKEGYKVTMEGLSRMFNKEFWNYAKLISGILRHGMPLPFVVDVVNTLNLESDSINTWRNGVERALKKFIPDGTMAVRQACPNCDVKDGLRYQEGCLVCKSCGYSKCG